MKKATLKTYLITLLVLLLSFAVMLTAFACNATDDTTEEEKPKEAAFESLVTNGNFASTSGDKAPYKPSNWSAYKPSGSTDDNTVAGVVDTGADYDKDSTSWGSAKNPFGAVTDKKVLMIYNKAENVYGYTNTFTASAYGYYSLSAKIKVVDADGAATFRVASNNGYSAFTINNTEAFTEYTFYIEAATVDSLTVTATLSLGYDTTKAKGYAFFYDVVAKEITAKEYTDAKSANADNTKCVSMLYPDGEFSYTDSSTSEPKTPTSWSETKSVKLDGTSLPSDDITSGVISATDAESWDATKYGDYPNVPAGATDRNILMLIANAKKDTSDTTKYYTPTAFYYESKTKIRIEPTALYEISVWANVQIDADTTNASFSSAKKGARIALYNAEYNSYVSSPITTTGWQQIKLYVLGNQLHAYDFSLRLWLGYNDSTETLMQGKVFFDGLTIKKTDEVATTPAERAAMIVKYSAFDVLDIDAEKRFDDVKQDVTDGVIKTNTVFTDVTTDDNGVISTTPAGYTFESTARVQDGDVIVAVIPKDKLLASYTWTEQDKETYGIEKNPYYPYNSSSVLIVNNVIPTAYKMQLTKDNCFEITQSLCYRISVWIKTIGLDDGKNVTLALLDEDDTSINSFSVNTSKYTNTITNDYVEYSFYLKGARPFDSATNTKKVRLAITNGSGTAYDPSSYQKGAFLVANVNMEQITYAEYKAVSSSDDYSATKDFEESSSSSVTNGNFNTYDVANTVYDQNTGFVAMQDKDGNDRLTYAANDWKNNVGKDYGTVKTGGTVLDPFTLENKGSKTSNKAISHTVNLGKDKITTIKMTGPNDFDKTFADSSEWNKYLSVNENTGYITWADSSTVYALDKGDYTITVTKGETVQNVLTAGIINLNTPDAYFAQFTEINKPNDKSWEEYLYSDWSADSAADTTKKLVSFGAPNLMIISARKGQSVTLNSDKKTSTTPLLKSSDKISLSGSSYYLLRCYARSINGAEGQIYLTTEATDSELFSHKIKKDVDGWVEYNFLVETGLNDVGVYFEIYYGERENTTDAYSGTILLDSFSKKELTKEEYETELEKSKVHTEKAKFVTLTFDNSSAKTSTVAPTGFTATPSSDASKDSTSQKVSGIISTEYANKDKLGVYNSEPKKDEEGNEVKDDDGNVVNEDVLDPIGADNIFVSDGMEEGMTVGDYLLMIDNLKENYQNYYLSSSLTLESESYYMFSAYVRTAKIEKDKYASVYVKISDEPSTFKVNTEYDKSGNEIENKWQKLSFYFGNEKSSSISDVKLYFELGENTDNGKLKGMLFVDNISLVKIDKETYEAASASYEYEKDDNGEYKTDENGNKIPVNAAFHENNIVKYFEDEPEKETPAEESDSSSSLSTTMLWTYITSITIAAVLIAVIVVWIIRKYRRPRKGTASGKKVGYDRNNVKSDTSDDTNTGSARDEYKE